MCVYVSTQGFTIRATARFVNVVDKGAFTNQSWMVQEAMRYVYTADIAAVCGGVVLKLGAAE